MKAKEINRLDEAALLRVLKRNKYFVADLILRLAWQAGLNRPQIHDLTWDQVSFEDAEIRLPTHTVPIHPDLLECLKFRRNKPSHLNLEYSEYVVLTDARHAHPHPVQISRIVAAALDTEDSLKDITIKNLRDDFIIRSLEEHGKPYTMRVSGIAMGTLYSTYGKYLSNTHGKNVEGKPSMSAEIDESRLMAFLSEEGSSDAAIALWLNWKQRMTEEETVSLTWDQVDFEKNVIRLPNRESTMHPVVAQLLKEILDSRDKADDPHVLLTPKARKPYLPDRLTVIIRTALFQKGLGTLHLGALSLFDDKKEKEDKVLSYVDEHRFITCKTVIALFQTTYAIAYDLLSRMVKQGKLVRVGTRYYREGAIVPPEKHTEVICNHLKEVGSSSSGDIARLLRIEKRACSWILHKMVDEGLIIQRGQSYLYPDNAT